MEWARWRPQNAWQMSLGAKLHKLKEAPEADTGDHFWLYMSLRRTSVPRERWKLDAQKADELRRRGSRKGGLLREAVILRVAGCGLRAGNSCVHVSISETGVGRRLLFFLAV
jgi:hypothetical protein